MGEIYQTYARRCYKAGAMDFDDLLFKTNILFRDHPEALHKYQHKFRYIMVDDYQDTNFSHYLIVKRLAAFLRNILWVGEDGSEGRRRGKGWASTCSSGWARQIKKKKNNQ